MIKSILIAILLIISFNAFACDENSTEGHTHDETGKMITCEDYLKIQRRNNDIQYLNHLINDLELMKTERPNKINIYTHRRMMEFVYKIAINHCKIEKTESKIESIRDKYSFFKEDNLLDKYVYTCIHFVEIEGSNSRNHE